MRKGEMRRDARKGEMRKDARKGERERVPVRKARPYPCIYFPRKKLATTKM